MKYIGTLDEVDRFFVKLRQYADIDPLYRKGPICLQVETKDGKIAEILTCDIDNYQQIRDKLKIGWCFAFVGVPSMHIGNRTKFIRVTIIEDSFQHA